MSHADKLDRTWYAIRYRCFNPNSTFYYRYGGRGITVCKEWDNKQSFREWAVNNGYADDLTIDRIDNDKGYSPDNCRWVSMKENCNNRSSCHYVTAFGETRSLREWGEILGLSYNTLKKRVIDHHEDGEYLLRPSRRAKEVIEV